MNKPPIATNLYSTLQHIQRFTGWVNPLISMGIFLSFLLMNCSGSPQKNTQSNTQDQQENGNSSKSEGQNGSAATLKPAPRFNADSAYQFVASQVAFGPRVPNTPAHQKCGDFLIRTLQNYGWEVQAQAFEAVAYDGTKLKSRNIIASYNPKATKRILLAAHWDTRPFADKDKKDEKKAIDGANDGASGVGILLEVARSVAQEPNKPAVGIDIIFFDSEDYGQPEFDKKEYKQDSWCLGSQYWAKNKHVPNYSAYYGILLDMVGAKNAKFYQEGFSKQFAPSIVQQVWGLALKIGLNNFFIPQESPTIIDDHYYINKEAKIPMINIVEYDPNNPESFFGKYHHTHDDNMSIIDKVTLGAVGQLVLQVIYQEEAPNT
jgi:hypothetical protein